MEIVTSASLDEFDRKILDIMQHEGRISMLELAERVGLSPTPCARRLKRLEERGIIDRYVAVLNPEALGMGLDAFVNVRLRDNSKAAAEGFERAMQTLPEVAEFYLVTGNYDYLLHLRLADANALKEFLRESLADLPIVGDTLTYIALEQKKWTTALALPEAIR
jgi:Lrp/AsnC family leucine-responsive transcriptional regulator